MFDTILLNIPFEKFEIQDRERFSPSARGFIGFPPIFMGNRKSIKATCNPTKDEKKKGYYPIVTLHKSLRRGGYQVYLHVQFSAAKLLYGNNFDEPLDTQLEAMIAALQARLKDMSIIIAFDDLKYAQVVGIHYAKNVALSDGSLPFDYIYRLAQIDQSLWLDTGKVMYSNGGTSFKLHTNAWELIIYDKRKDLEQAKRSERKAISKDNYTQLNLLEKLPKGLQFEVIRIELRLNNTKAIRQHLERTGVTKEQVPELTLNSLLDDFVAMRLLLHYLERLEASYPAVHKHTQTNPLNLLTELRINNPDSRLETIFAGVAYSVLLDQLTDAREVRMALGAKGAKQWLTLRKRLSQLNTNHTEKDVFKMLTHSIIKEDRLRMADYYLDGTKQ